MEIIKLRLYRISADGGKTWTEQWLTAAEAAEIREVYHDLCELVTPYSSKELHAPVCADDANKKAENTISRPAELRFLLSYVSESCFDNEICRDRLRMLWTAYCLHHNLDVDTSGYDNDLLELWNKLAETGDGTADWSDYGEFYNYMCTYLT